MKKKVYEYNQTKVRSEFAYMRRLMQAASDMMRQGITDYSEKGEAGQLALELCACAITFEAYLVERRTNKGEAE